MRENEFEKGVKKTMGDFHLQPSASVWPEVERRIRERRRRRGFVFWFSLSGLLLAGLAGWWWLGETGQKRTASHSVHTQKQVYSPATNAEKSSYAAEKITEAASSGDKSVTTDTKNRVEKGTVLYKKSTEKEITPVSIKNPGLTAKPEPSRTNHRQTGNPKNNSRPVNKKPVSLPGVLQSKQEGEQITPALSYKQNVAARKPEGADTAVAINSEKTTPVGFTAIPDTARKLDMVQKNDSVAINETAAGKSSQKKKSAWEKGLYLSVGRAVLTEGLGTFGQKSMEFQSGGTVSNPGNSNMSYADSVALTGTHLQAGFYIRRYSGKRTSFSLGLGGAVYATRQRTGNYVDTNRAVSFYQLSATSGGYYQAAGSRRYTNRYIYLQTPLFWHWQLNKGRDFPLMEWESGLIPSFLAGSRALVYDPVNHIFFREKSVYNRFSLAAQTGLNLTLFPESKHPLRAGLYYNYHFSQLQKTRPPAFNHLSGWGLQLRWIISK